MLYPRRFSGYPTVLKSLKRAVRRLGAKGLLKNPDTRSWHPHALRHSFSTECSHAGVKPEVREFLMGHISGIAWVYQHPEIHEDDILQDYKKVESFISLNETETVLRDEFESREKTMMKALLEMRSELDAMNRRLAAQSGNLLSSSSPQSSYASPPAPSGQ